MGSASQLFDTLAPDLAADARKGDFLSLAETRTSPRAYGAQRAYAVALLALHMLTRSIRQQNAGTSNGGAIASETEGSLSRSFADAGLSGGQNGDLPTTSWGQMLMELRRESIIGIRTSAVT